MVAVRAIFARLVGVSILAAASATVAYVTLTREGMETSPKEKVTPRVTVQAIAPVSATDPVQGQGQVRARWQTTLTSEVRGRVRAVSERFHAGSLFAKGDLLATVDATAYELAFAQARAALAAATRVLSEEEQRAKVAAESWISSGLTGKPPALVVREPQLDEAQAALDAARAALKKAEYDLARTRVTAPYDGVVLERNINPGDFLQIGSRVGRIYDRRVYEVVVPLGSHELARLTPDVIGTAATLRSGEDRRTWTGEVARVGPAIDPTNHWRHVIIEIDDTEHLLPGQYLTAEFEGQSYERVLFIPENIVAKDGHIWFVDAREQLAKFHPRVLFRRHGQLAVLAPPELGRPLRVTPPSSSFLPGVKVLSIADGAEGSEILGSVARVQ